MWTSFPIWKKKEQFKRFEFTVELAWKTLKDYLEFSGVVLDQNTPKNVNKAGVRSQNYQRWSALD